MGPMGKGGGPPPKGVVLGPKKGQKRTQKGTQKVPQIGPQKGQKSIPLSPVTRPMDDIANPTPWGPFLTYGKGPICEKKGGSPPRHCPYGTPKRGF